jgi:hypothetical protein
MKATASRVVSQIHHRAADAYRLHDQGYTSLITLTVVGLNTSEMSLYFYENSYLRHQSENWFSAALHSAPLSAFLHYHICCAAYILHNLFYVSKSRPSAIVLSLCSSYETREGCLVHNHRRQYAKSQVTEFLYSRLNSPYSNCRISY